MFFKVDLQRIPSVRGDDPLVRPHPPIDDGAGRVPADLGEISSQSVIRKGPEKRVTLTERLCKEMPSGFSIFGVGWRVPCQRKSPRAFRDVACRVADKMLVATFRIFPQGAAFYPLGREDPVT